MASCYKCGASGSTYRRNVQIGYSRSLYAGRRLFTRFTTYHGTRTVCESCAYILDRGKAVTFVTIQVLIMAVIIYIFVK